MAIKETATKQIRIFPRTHYMLSVSAAKRKMSIAEFIHYLICPPRKDK
jgi:predicted HicB family RNase H-like nuclease